MSFFFVCIALVVYVVRCESEGLLRATRNAIEGESSSSSNVQEHRELWDFVAGKRISGQGWYNNYTPAQIPSNKNSGDGRDYFRAADKCFKHGSSGPLHRKYCPKPPNCSFSGKFGKAKLCINRLPLPDHSEWYVAAMGCIPYWENCDKCMCGDMKNGRCKLNLNSHPDDDDTKVNCNNLHKVTMSGVTYTL